MPATPLRTFRAALTRSLRLRVLGLTLATFVAISIPAYLSFVWIVDTTTVKLATLFAEKQVLYDRYRGLEALIRELALAETLARSPSIIDWGADEADPDKRRRGMAELEHYRLAFRDGSYFFAIEGSGNYCFNDAANSFSQAPLRYTLSDDNPRDGWFFKTIAAGPGCQLNVNNDDNLGVTKVWINCVVADGARTLGVLGTGIDLTTFIREVVNPDQVGVDSMFVDQGGAVQADRDRSRIDFHSLMKSADARKTVFQRIDSEADRATLTAMMRAVSQGQDNVKAQFMTVDGRSMLVGVGYLDQLGWYNVTLMDVSKVIDRSLFRPIAVLLGLMMLAAAALVTWLFKRSVLDRLAITEQSVARIEAGDFSPVQPVGGKDEISRLAGALTKMAASVRANTGMLEEAVRERTAQLESIAYLDPLTSAMNRRGFVEAFALARDRALHQQTRLGLLLLDIDRFKTINDTRGHRVGDEVIVSASARLHTVLRGGDICARWGGDEFVILIDNASIEAMEEISARAVDALRTVPVALSNDSKLRITCSIGGYLLERGDHLDLATHRADLALYAAKRAGRNRTVIYDPDVHGGAGANKVA
jgi:diguanylate cyclase (GGDEF)-like protein